MFVLTHNFSLFRQVRNWFQHVHNQNRRDESKRPAQFYMTDTTTVNEIRSSAIKKLDPLLLNFDSEYQFLFSLIHGASHSTDKNSLEDFYQFPNIARRLLETFLAFRTPHITGSLRQKLKLVPFDEAKKISILRFVDTYSHGNALEDPQHDMSILGETPSVLSDLLKLIRESDPDHYCSMVRLVSCHT